MLFTNSGRKFETDMLEKKEKCECQQMANKKSPHGNYTGNYYGLIHF